MKPFNFEKTVAKLSEKELDFKHRLIPFSNGKMEIFFISQLVDKIALAASVIKPIVTECDTDKEITAELVANSIIYAEDCQLLSDTENIQDYILKGMVVIIFSNDCQFIVVNFRKVEKRAVSEAQIEYSIRGPQDCFTENLDTNLSLIRYRVKDKNLRIKNFDVGRRTKSRVAVVYIQDVANNAIVKEVEKNIKKIDVDGIAESGELQSAMLGKKMTLFPTIGLMERSDYCFHSLIEGKVVIMIDGSGVALVVPKVFVEYFHSSDDIYDNKYFGLYSRIFRYVAALITITATSMFVALTSFHTDVLPTEYAIALAEMRSNVPTNALIGALLLEFITELLRESLLRVPKQIGSAIGIVGAIIIGQAAVSAGIFSPLLLIVASLSLLASFAVPDYTIMNPLRILKYFLLVATGLFGFYGFTIVLTFILSELVSTHSYGVPYMAPWAPFNKYDFKRSFMDNITISPKRPHLLRTKNTTRVNKSNSP